MRYIHRVDVYLNEATPDEYGGNVLTERKIGSSWAKVNTISRTKEVRFGLDTVSQALEINLRSRADLDYEQEGLFFKYKGKEWIPISVEDIDLDGEEIRIIATLR